MISKPLTIERLESDEFVTTMEESNEPTHDTVAAVKAVNSGYTANYSTFSLGETSSSATSKPFWAHPGQSSNRS
jgi:hypothetical protein